MHMDGVRAPTALVAYLVFWGLPLVLSRDERFVVDGNDATRRPVVRPSIPVAYMSLRRLVPKGKPLVRLSAPVFLLRRVLSPPNMAHQSPKAAMKALPMKPNRKPVWSVPLYLRQQ